MKYTSRINNFNECINYLNRVQFFFSVSCLRKTGGKYEATNLSRFWNIFWILFTVSLMFGGISVKLSLPQYSQQILDSSPILMIVGIIGFILVSLVTLVTSFSMMADTDKYIDLINQINSMDQLFNQEFHYQINYEKLMKKNRIVCKTLTVYYCIACTCCAFILVEGDYLIVFVVMFCYVYLVMGAFITGFAHMNYTDVIGKRFRLINCLLDSKYLLAEFPNPVERDAKISILLRMFKDLFKWIEVINEIFGMYLKAALLHCFLQTVFNLFIILGFENETFIRPLTFIGLLLPPIYGLVRFPMKSSAAMKEVSGFLL